MAFIRKKTKPNGIKIDDPCISARNDGEFTVIQLLKLAKLKSISISPLDIHGLVKVLGVKLFCIPMSDEVSGSLSLSDNQKDWVIRVNALHHPNRQRFTIAHELGHFACHRSEQAIFEDQNFFRNGKSNFMEMEANQFAGELLMPEDLFRNYVKDLNGSIEKVAQHFQVSTLAVRVRAKSLGMKGHGLE